MKVLLVADLHLRHDRPLCRQDDWMDSQRNDLENVCKIARSKFCEEIWLLGDIFHRPVEPPEIVNMVIDTFKRFGIKTFAICGNHDLQYHSISNWSKSSMSTLFTSGVVEFFDSDIHGGALIHAYDFGQEPETHVFESDITITHQLVFPDDETRGIAGGKIPEDIFSEFKSSKVVLMGDYHDGWDCIHEGQKQIMVGCMNIQSGKLADYKPRVVVFDTETFDYESVYLPQDFVKVTTEHLVSEKERDERMSEACLAIGESIKVELDFIGNLRQMKVENCVSDIITEVIENLNKESK